MSSRGSRSPPPTYSTFGSEGATAIAPTPAIVFPLSSLIFCQLCPPFVVRQTPPFTAPM
jgi:hypothetical protein